MGRGQRAYQRAISDSGGWGKLPRKEVVVVADENDTEPRPTKPGLIFRIPYGIPMVIAALMVLISFAPQIAVPVEIWELTPREMVDPERAVVFESPEGRDIPYQFKRRSFRPLFVPQPSAASLDIAPPVSIVVKNDEAVFAWAIMFLACSVIALGVVPRNVISKGWVQYRRPGIVGIMVAAATVPVIYTLIFPRYNPTDFTAPGSIMVSDEFGQRFATTSGWGESVARDQINRFKRNISVAPVYSTNRTYSRDILRTGYAASWPIMVVVPLVAIALAFRFFRGSIPRRANSALLTRLFGVPSEEVEAREQRERNFGVRGSGIRKVGE